MGSASQSSLIDKLLGKMRVKVTMDKNTDRHCLCGDLVRIDEETGDKYFLIPAHAADYIKSIFPHFKVEEYTEPPVVEPKKVEIEEDDDEEEEEVKPKKKSKK